ncbi:MAG: alanine dehydrogenase [Rhodothermales bacterium]
MESPEYSVGSSSQSAVVPLEKPLRPERNGRRQSVGVPREVVNEERRVALSPSGVGALVASGHDVFVQMGAGKQAHFSDRLYTSEGAEIVDSAADIYERCDLIVKVAPPSGEELDLLREKQILISALHLGNATKDFFRRLMELSVTGIGFEFIKTHDGTYPIVRMMHEIMGSMSIQIAARYLESPEGGAGLVLGGISGVPPAHVLILGAGVVGEWAARTALGFGARVTVLDSDLASLRALEHYLDRRITTAMANETYIRHYVESADVIVGAMVHGGSRSPVLVTEDMVASMRPGSVVVDAVIDQGGCIETSRPTSHSQPVFTEHGVIHYCVPNMPSNAARTATDALTNVLVPFLLEIGAAETVNEALWRNEGLRNGTYVYRKHLTKKSLASLFGMPHRDVELLIASGI